MRFPSHLYAMVDTSAGHEPVALARQLLDGGARILQLRLKDCSSRDLLAIATTIAGLCHDRGALFIVNDRADIAKLAGADAVHVGQADLPLAAARAVVGDRMFVGVSTHTIEQASAAETGGADYIGFGAIYSGGLKNVANAQGLDRLRAVRSAVKLPIVAIGGITQTTTPDVLAAGADAVAIITDIVRASDLPAKVRALLALEPAL
jgi:thiamine-phosphate diphosphorylase